MTGVTDFKRSLDRSRAASAMGNRPEVFAMAGREWDLLDGVFSPDGSATTAVAMELLGLTGEAGPAFQPRGTFLEVGPGTGVIAVSAALAGCRQVVATDISAAAVRNTAMNAERHGVADRLTSLSGDLFAAVGDGERFDTVYWHSNYVLAPPDYRYATDHERAYVDPGYRAHRRYLAEVSGLLAEGGTALLQFSQRGDLGLLLSLAEEYGRILRPLRRKDLHEGDETIELVLYEICVTN